MNTQPPFIFRPFSDVGTTEPFVARVALDLPELLDGTLYQNKQDIKESILRSCLECLIPAFVSLRELRKIADRTDAPVLNKTKHFDDMCKSLWSAYKDRMQTSAELMGYGIGFAFEDDSKFEKGCANFSKVHPEISPVLIAELRIRRATWQGELSRFRNQHLEHQTIKREDIASFYSLRRAESLFHSVCLAIEETLVILIAAKLPPGVILREIPDSQRNPACPQRFGWAWAP